MPDSIKALVTVYNSYINEGDNGYEVDLPEPSSYSSSTSTVIDSGTSVSGHLLGGIVRDSVAKVSLSWNYLCAEKWAEINALFKDGGGKPRYVNRVRFFDQTTNDWSEREMYVSDRSAGMWRRDLAGNVCGWLDCKLELTEV